MMKQFLCAAFICAAGVVQADIMPAKTDPLAPATPTVQTWPHPDSLPKRQISKSEARMRLLVILAAEIAGAERLAAQNSR
jgi:hypothetical protein